MGSGSSNKFNSNLFGQQANSSRTSQMGDKEGSSENQIAGMDGEQNNVVSSAMGMSVEDNKNREEINDKSAIGRQIRRHAVASGVASEVPLRAEPSAQLRARQQDNERKSASSRRLFIWIVLLMLVAAGGWWYTDGQLSQQLDSFAELDGHRVPDGFGQLADNAESKLDAFIDKIISFADTDVSQDQLLHEGALQNDQASAEQVNSVRAPSSAATPKDIVSARATQNGDQAQAANAKEPYTVPTLAVKEVVVNNSSVAKKETVAHEDTKPEDIKTQDTEPKDLGDLKNSFAKEHISSYRPPQSSPEKENKSTLAKNDANSVSTKPVSTEPVLTKQKLDKSSSAQSGSSQASNSLSSNVVSSNVVVKESKANSDVRNPTLPEPVSSKPAKSVPAKPASVAIPPRPVEKSTAAQTEATNSSVVSRPQSATIAGTSPLKQTETDRFLMHQFLEEDSVMSVALQYNIEIKEIFHSLSAIDKFFKNANLNRAKQGDEVAFLLQADTLQVMLANVGNERYATIRDASGDYVALMLKEGKADGQFDGVSPEFWRAAGVPLRVKKAIDSDYSERFAIDLKRSTKANMLYSIEWLDLMSSSQGRDPQSLLVKAYLGDKRVDYFDPRNNEDLVRRLSQFILQGR